MARSEDYYLRVLFEETKVKELMQKNYPYLNEGDELILAEQAFLSQAATHLPIIDEGKKLVGMLSQKYLYKAQSPRKILDGEVTYGKDVIIDGGGVITAKIC